MSDGGNGAELVARVLEAARELSRHDDPGVVLRHALAQGRRVIRFDRSLAATRRELEAPSIRITRSDAPGTAFHDPTGRNEFPPLAGGLLAELLYAGQPRLIDDFTVTPDDPSTAYLAGMRSLAAVPQFRGGEAVDMIFHLRREPAAFSRESFAEIVLTSSFLNQAVSNLARVREVQESERSMKEQYDIIAQLSNNVMDSALNLKDYSKTLERRVRERTADLAEANLETIYMLALASEAKDQDTGEHLRRIQFLAQSLASELGMDEHEAESVGHAAILHDVGKMHVPDEILKKPSSLTPEETAVMREHTIWGERILGEKPYFAVARRIARNHHENFDGSGYPDRIAGDSIAVEARIVHLADVYDALTNPRVYKSAWSPIEAMDFIREASGQMFDPEVVKAFGEIARREEDSASRTTKDTKVTKEEDNLNSSCPS
jgi:putative nucleotidyltransferase with HDIG domain